MINKCLSEEWLKSSFQQKTSLTMTHFSGSCTALLISEFFERTGKKNYAHIRNTFVVALADVKLEPN